jgi:hypothetical protein
MQKTEFHPVVKMPLSEILPTRRSSGGMLLLQLLAKKVQIDSLPSLLLLEV